MAGTIEGGRKAAAKNKMLYGEDFYKRLGHLGGKAQHNGGFANDTVVGRDGLTGRQRAVVVGRKGGKASRRRPADFTESED